MYQPFVDSLCSVHCNCSCNWTFI